MGNWFGRDDLQIPSPPFFPAYANGAQGKGPPPMVHERFQSVISQLFQHVSEYANHLSFSSCSSSYSECLAVFCVTFDFSVVKILRELYAVVELLMMTWQTLLLLNFSISMLLILTK